MRASGEQRLCSSFPRHEHGRHTCAYPIEAATLSVQDSFSQVITELWVCFMEEIPELLSTYYTFSNRKWGLELCCSIWIIFLFLLFWIKTRYENKILRLIILCVWSTLDQRQLHRRYTESVINRGSNLTTGTETTKRLTIEDFHFVNI